MTPHKTQTVGSLTVTDSGELLLEAPGVTLQGGAPAAMILTGPEEREVRVAPAGRADGVREYREKSLLGPMRVREFDWAAAGPDVGFRCRVGVLPDGAGFTLQAAVRNSGTAPFRLREIHLLGAGATRVTVAGDPAVWHLHGLNYEGANLAERRESSPSDGGMP